MVNFQVAIDGPAGSGKSSISKLVADKLNFVHIDTGAMYRAVTLEALRRKLDVNLEENFEFVNDIKIEYKDNIIYLNDENVSLEVRSRNVTKNVSAVSKHQIVRDKMLEFQRISATYGYILMDGRDIGTVVLPNADIKIFLTASKEERAKRRYIEQHDKGSSVTYEEVYHDIVERDYTDMNRELSPLVQASDAILIDTTNVSIEDVCNKIINLVNERLEKNERN